MAINPRLGAGRLSGVRLFDTVSLPVRQRTDRPAATPQVIAAPQKHVIADRADRKRPGDADRSASSFDAIHQTPLLSREDTTTGIENPQIKRSRPDIHRCPVDAFLSASWAFPGEPIDFLNSKSSACLIS